MEKKGSDISLLDRYEAILDAVPEILMEVDSNKVYTWANKSGIDFFGDDVIGKEAAFYFIGEQNTYQTVKPVFEGDKNIVYLESWQRRKDGEKRLLAWWCRTLKNDKGQIVGAFSSARDITGRKKLEEKIETSQKLLQKVIDLLPIRVFWKDKDLKYLGCNQIFAKDAGMARPEDLIGKDDFQMGWKEQAEIYRADDQKVIDSKTAKLNFEEPQTTPKGDKIWLKTSKVPLIDHLGGELGVLGTYEDITERKEMEEKIQKHITDLEIFYKAAKGREERIIQLKKENDELLKKADLPPKYNI